jgi:pyruvate formate lyase activating enzyme
MIAGIEPCSFIDYPGRIAVVLFLQGCNLSCPYCHNPELTRRSQQPLRSPDEALFWLKRRVGRLSAVVVTGGEPTLQPELPRLLAAVRALGYRVKLDTNGTKPNVLRQVVDESLVDYVAMDIKDLPNRYAAWLSPVDVARPILESAELLRQSQMDHEFRTTVVFPQHDVESLDQLRHVVGNESRWYLQLADLPRSSLAYNPSPAALDALRAIAQELRTRGAGNLHVRHELRSTMRDASQVADADPCRPLI